MLGRNKGLTLLEVMIGGMILLMAVGFFVVTYVNFESRLAAYRYHYVAINLLRDCLEFGESENLGHELKLWYKYPPGEKNWGRGVNQTTGYAVKEWWFFALGNPDPFDYLGDIKAKGLVPREYPESVEIYYEVKHHNFPDTGVLRLSTARISWKENLPGRTEAVQREEELAVVPITNYNDQLNLSTGRFWWEKR